MSPSASRLSSLHRWLDRRLELPLVLLGFIWLALLVIELWRGESVWITRLSNGIWFVFVADFCLRWATASKRMAFVKKNWIAALSLAIPAFRVLRVFRAIRLLRAARVARGLRLIRVVSRLNRGLNSLARVLQRRRFGYVVFATVLVAIGGGAGMYALEADERTFSSIGEAIWWTAMLLTTMGSEHWPRSPEGRALCLVLAIYGFAVFGYLTATLATWFLGSDKKDAAPDATVEALREIERQLAVLGRDVQAATGPAPKDSSLPR